LHEGGIAELQEGLQEGRLQSCNHLLQSGNPAIRQSCNPAILQSGNPAILQSCNPAMPTFKVTLAYDGTDFVGWQRQPSGESIQGVLEDALHSFDDRDVAVTGAGRTDAGVHALGQVAAFSLRNTIDAETLARALNAKLPETIRVLSACEVPETFNPRYDARAKTYRYRIWNGPALSPFERRYAWHVPVALDAGTMDAAARRLEGRHNFAAFQAAGSDVETTERTITSSRVVKLSTGRLATTEDTEDAGGGTSPIADRPIADRQLADHPIADRQLADHPIADHPIADRHLHVPRVLRGGDLLTRGGDLLTPGGQLIAYEVTGDGFLRHMVRALVGTLVEIGRGRRPVEWIDEVIASRDRAVAGPTVPATGLFLVRVDY
jgi:tRNA pseudouridine38-40 synthase